MKVLITGANKGVGFQALKGLAAKGFKCIMGCRNLTLGSQARHKLAEQTGVEVDLLQIDMDRNQILDKAVQTIKERYGRLDILINNAAIIENAEDFSHSYAQKLFRTNVFGLIYLTQRALAAEVIAKGGKIINVTSKLGKWPFTVKSPSARELFSSAGTLPQLMKVAQAYLGIVKEDKLQQNGFYKTQQIHPLYNCSKLLVNLYTLQLGQRLKEAPIQVYSLSPGYCKTDMTKHLGTKPADEGAKTYLYLCELQGGVQPLLQGQFFQNCAMENIQ